MGCPGRFFAPLVLAIGSPAFAQDAEPPQAPLPILCELHVWPGSDLRSTYHGWFHGGIVDGAVQGREGYRKLPDKPLPTKRQVEILRSLPLAELTGLRGHQVVLHDYALDSRTLRRNHGRLAPDTPQCYAELAIDDVFFQEDAFDGRFLKILFRFRAFNGGDVPARSFGTYIQEKLTLFPPKAAEEDATAAIKELGTAYVAVVRKFGVALISPPKSRKSR